MNDLWDPCNYFQIGSSGRRKLDGVAINRAGVNERRSLRDAEVIHRSCRAWSVAVSESGARGGWQDGTHPGPRLPDRPAAHPLALHQEQAQPADRPDALRRGAGYHEVLRVRQVPQAHRRLPRDTVRDTAGRQQPLFPDESAESLGGSQVKDFFPCV